ncbi:hypothetical protein LEP1GSC151_5867 [Leptospira interrogans serovar Grippotyphosa str. LT2186]|uniref:Uncharacterized protein n=1 Tax=Leptospira interrogans serovar Grippotyphosa str. LT2186 TaxID=1001599 RepID=M3IDP1_LEPIR|nr:hypothetical protein LEP1GSC151_5867 [Leptospira interrogans serovar Grippotyphosa str. LT2186]
MNNNVLVKLNILILFGMSIVSCSNKSESKEKLIKIEEFSKKFISEYLEKRYMFSEASEMTEIEKNILMMRLFLIQLVI